jgi:hypothetical protein
MKRSMLWIALAFVFLAPLHPTRADSLGFFFSDPVGDSTGRIDVVGMSMTFNNDTGAFIITIQATQAQPFFGDFRVNINLCDPDVNGTCFANAFFQDNLVDSSFAVPATTLTLTGTAPVLTYWEAGDRVETNSLPVEPLLPPQFASAVLDLPPTCTSNILCSAGDRIAYGPDGITTISAVPEPSTILLLGTALAMAVVCSLPRSRST